jgi:2-methylcitrate dehydratase PrpD
MSIALQLSQYLISVFQRDLPKAVKKMGINAIIDQYGLQIAGSELPWSKALYNVEKNYTGSRGKSTITRYNDKVSPTSAAFINGSFAHAIDFDDTHPQAQMHAGSVVIPAAIAIGEQNDIPGSKVLNAIIWGMEIMLRLAHSLSPACMQGGHHTPPTIGPFGSAIACGLLLGLNEQQLANALGICGSFSGALMEYTLSGGSVKRIHTGLGARAGLEAVLLAKEGLTGPQSIIEGKKGMWSIYGRGAAHPERLLDKLGERFLLSSLQFKSFSCCLLIHPAIEAVMKICNAYQLKGEDVESVSVGYSQFSTSHVGSIIIPKDELGAQFSTSFMLALSLIKETPTMWTNINEALSDSKIIDLAKRVTVYEEAKAQKYFPEKNGCLVHVNTKDGQNYSCRILDLRKRTDIKKKFLQCTLPILGVAKGEELYQSLKRFDKLPLIMDFF